MQIPETEITEAFLRIYFTLKHHGDQVLTRLIQDLQTAKSGKLLWSEDIVELNKQIADIACQERLLAQLKQQAVVDPDIFIIQHLRQEQDQANQRIQRVTMALKSTSNRLTEWDDGTIYQLLEKVTVLSRERIRVTLRDGLEIEQAVEQPKRRKFA